MTIVKLPPMGVRHLQVLFLFTCAVLTFHQRVSLSVGIVAMTNANTTNPDFPEYELSEREKSYMLGSIYWGSTLTHLLGGYLSSRYGAKLLLLCSVLGTSVLGLCLPVAIDKVCWRLFCVIRILQGLFQGVMWPSLYSHLAKWCPKKERNRLGGIAQTGLDIGTALGFAASGLLAASPLGWPSMFYVPGVIGIIWSLLWIIFGASSPEKSSFISQAELQLIQSSQETPVHSTTKRSIPFCAIITSVPYIVLAICKVSQATSYHTLMQQIPTYLHGIFNYDIKINALLSALPFVFMCVMSYVCLVVADILTHNELVSLTVIRKSINSFASWVPAVSFIALAYMDAENVVGSIICLVICVASISAQAIGSSLNHIDLSPNYAGFLFGLTTTLMSIAGVLSPVAISFVVTDESDREQWRIVFIAIALILFFGNLLYIIFGQMTVQPWNDPITKSTEQQQQQGPSEHTTKL
ncbi:putative inorganic phosphate cotransporter [Teleopsis dalmanni]|uniref:putative inorganic phosphate cotransporter n=1 Tax=Teleopsis dalmanni TaxID=139649 RepID=UPI0018CD3445|nr:putative inorganic phosphate cotransporter [Teleopsis dalmanni]